MNKFILLLVFIISVDLFATTKNKTIENKTIENNLNLFPWQSSTTVCAASTRCPNGRIISCKVFGSQYHLLPGHMYNSCSWIVYPGQAVACRGYQQVYNPIYRMTMWQWINIPIRCF